MRRCQSAVVLKPLCLPVATCCSNACKLELCGCSVFFFCYYQLVTTELWPCRCDTSKESQSKQPLFHHRDSKPARSELDLLCDWYTWWLLHSVSCFFRGYTYYKMGNLDNRVANADQLLTQDVEKFCNSVVDLYSNVSKVLPYMLMINQISQYTDTQLHSPSCRCNSARVGCKCTVHIRVSSPVGRVDGEQGDTGESHWYHGYMYWKPLTAIILQDRRLGF